MVTTDSVPPVDVSPILVSEIIVNGRRLVAEESLCVAVECVLDEGEPLFLLSGEFGITCWAETLMESLELYWEEFTESEPDQLASQAQEIRRQMRSRLMPSDHAA